MRSASLLLVFVLAKAAMIWGHAAPVTAWWPLAYVWQDAMAALAFAAFDLALRKIGAPTSVAWVVYGVAAIYAAINIPVGRVVSTPLTRPMLRAARGPALRHRNQSPADRIGARCGGRLALAVAAHTAPVGQMGAGLRRCSHTARAVS